MRNPVHWVINSKAGWKRSNRILDHIRDLVSVSVETQIRESVWRQTGDQVWDQIHLKILEELDCRP